MKELIRKLYYLRSFLRFKSYGTGIILSLGGTILRPNEIVLGSNVFINRKFHISARNLIVGSDVMIGPNLIIECDNHKFNKIGKTMFSQRDERSVKGVKIGDDVWIGANVTLLSGAKVSNGCVIGACSLVNKFVPPYTICYGIPAKPVKARFTKEELNAHLVEIKQEKSFDEIIDYWKKYSLI